MFDGLPARSPCLVTQVTRAHVRYDLLIKGVTPAGFPGRNTWLRITCDTETGDTVAEIVIAKK